MADESEKRFHAIMDKLFHTPPKPKSTPPTSDSTSLSGVQLSRGKKRPNMGSVLAVVGKKSRGGGGLEELQNSSSGTVEAPLCRPWDRGDLLKRLATFKSMTWFAKPEVVNAVNCTRRGWVNVDMDILACESCGARLLFSTPSSWTQEQVEKAALVFSLKLNNGHKLLCPWVDNACDETLAQFPPTPAANLVENYKNRCAALSQLVALPVISSLAIDFMRSPQLEHFLSSSSTTDANKSIFPSSTETLGNECDELFSILYYQAQKLISLCGWDPRSLPYIVDCNREDQSLRNGNLLDPSIIVPYGMATSISVYSSGTGHNVEPNKVHTASIEQYDPNSIVLDCRLCGASVGLWAFCTTPRPVEFIRIIGHSGEHDETIDVDHSHNSDCSSIQASGYKSLVGSREGNISTATTDTTSSDGMHLNLTIAGGPPPAEQNFRPTISLPVIGQNLRARFSSEFESTDDADQPLKALYEGNKEHSSNIPGEQPFQQEDMRLIQSETGTVAYCISVSKGPVEAVRDDSNYMSMEIVGTSGNEIPDASKTFSRMENPVGNIDRTTQIASTLNKPPENLITIETADQAAGYICSSQVVGTSLTSLEAQDLTGKGKSSLVYAPLTDAAVDGYMQQNPVTDTTCEKQVDRLKGLESGALITVNSVNNDSRAYSSGKDLKQLPGAKSMEFNPIMQHRYFCPWITSSGSAAPGWKQTLAALQRQKEFSCPSPPSSSLIKVDDPVGSVKKLLTPPSVKRKKLAHGSS